MSAELETAGAASGFSGIVIALLWVVRDVLKSRNGNSVATKKDIETVSTKLSTDITGVYDRIDGMKEGCFTRHLDITDKLYDRNARIGSLERR